MTVSYTAGGTAVAADYGSLSRVGGEVGTTGIATIAVTVSDDEIDEPLERVTLTLTDAAAYDVGTRSTTTVAISDDDPTTVTLARSGVGCDHRGGRHSRRDGHAGTGAGWRGETVVVPLSIVGVTTDDFTLALKSGTSVNTGVSLADEGTLAPLVTFSGTGAQTAMLEFAAVQDDIDEGASETATITLGDLADSGTRHQRGGRRGGQRRRQAHHRRQHRKDRDHR